MHIVKCICRPKALRLRVRQIWVLINIIPTELYQVIIINGLDSLVRILMPCNVWECAVHERDCLSVETRSQNQERIDFEEFETINGLPAIRYRGTSQVLRTALLQCHLNPSHNVLRENMI